MVIHDVGEAGLTIFFIRDATPATAREKAAAHELPADAPGTRRRALRAPPLAPVHGAPDLHGTKNGKDIFMLNRNLKRFDSDVHPRFWAYAFWPRSLTMMSCLATGVVALALASCTPDPTPVVPDAAVPPPDAPVPPPDAPACPDGQQDNDGDGTCSPDCASTDCGANSVCDDSDGTATCSCVPGFSDDGSGVCVSVAGCADGAREGFVDIDSHPDIAGCSGGWSVPGVLSTTSPACNRQSGDDSANPAGSGCNVEDLCAPGWHVCATPAEVAAASPDGCTSATRAGDPQMFFTTRQSGLGNSICGEGANDFFGCANMGLAADPGTCTPLTHGCENLCSALTTDWSCGTDGFNEANNVIKTAAAGGGALCCRDECTGDLCASGAACVMGRCAAHVFLSSIQSDGNLGGLAGADALCQQAADANGIAGTFKAWLSDSTVSAASRLTQWPIPYVLLDGTVVADNWADLTDGTIDAPINVSSNGERFDDVAISIWSSTLASGEISGTDNCNDWTSNDAALLGTMGNNVTTDSTWSLLPNTASLCDNFGTTLFCLQQ